RWTRRARATAARPGRRRPAGRAPRAWSARGSWRRTSRQLLSGDALVALAVAVGRPADDVVGELGRGRLPVPSRERQEVAHVLLVVGGRRAARCVRRRLPVARGIGRERLVDERELAVVEAELELRVREDQA